MTTPMPSPEDFPRELLAAYADGELDADGRAMVERFLSDCPHSLEELQTQREFSPANVSLWERVEPLEPLDCEWAVVRKEIEHRLVPATPRFSRWRTATWAMAGLATIGVAASVAWVALGLVHPPQSDSSQIEEARGIDQAPFPREVAAIAPAPHSADPLAAFAVLPIASDSDVILHRVPEFSAGWLPVGQHPVSGVLTLATEEEIQLGEVAPHSAWPMGDLKMTTAPGDAPLIFITKFR